MRLLVSIAGFLVGGLLVIGAVVLIGSQAGSPAPAAQAAVQHETFTISGSVRHHGVQGPNIAIWPGRRVVLVIYNSSPLAHTFTSSELGVNQIILPGSAKSPSRTAISFVAHRYGIFDWQCLICPSRAQGHAELMRGLVYAIIGRPAVSGVTWH
jgi:hypothetical protein